LTPASTWHFGPEFGREHLQMPVYCIAEERHKLQGSVAPIHVESEQTAVLAANVTSQALHGSLVTVSGRAVTCYEGQDVGRVRYDAVPIKVVGIRRFGAEVYG